MAGNHTSGSKITRSHTTLIDIAVPIIHALEKHTLTNKISLGIIKKISVGQPRIKFLPITGGFKLVIRGRITIQEFFVYSKDSDTLQTYTLALFNKKFPQA
jgi:hypothetical protein